MSEPQQDVTPSLSERVALAMGHKKPSPLASFGEVWPPDFENDERAQGEMLGWLMVWNLKREQPWQEISIAVDKCGIETDVCFDGWYWGRPEPDCPEAQGPTINVALCSLILELAEAPR